MVKTVGGSFLNSVSITPEHYLFAGGTFRGTEFEFVYGKIPFIKNLEQFVSYSA
jgi:hypothetical protein